MMPNHAGMLQASSHTLPLTLSGQHFRLFQPHSNTNSRVNQTLSQQTNLPPSFLKHWLFTRVQVHAKKFRNQNIPVFEIWICYLEKENGIVQHLPYPSFRQLWKKTSKFWPIKSVVNTARQWFCSKSRPFYKAIRNFI